MKISARAEYAFKAVLELSVRYQKDSPVQLHVIARAQKIPEKFLVQLLSRLKNAHIVYSSRGVSGGYCLARPPSQISLADVIGAVDDNMIDKAHAPGAGRMSDAEQLLNGIWQELNAGVREKLEGITMDQAVMRFKKEEPVYQI